MTTSDHSLRLLKTETACKVGRRSTGTITYALLREGDGCLVTILSNSSGGYFSREFVPISRIEACFQGVDLKKPISAKIFREAFQGKSANNAGFLAAVLRHEGLLEAASDATHQHRIHGDWQEWKANLLKLSGRPYVPGALSASPNSASSALISQEPGTPAGRRGRKNFDGGKRLPTGANDASPQ